MRFGSAILPAGVLAVAMLGGASPGSCGGAGSVSSAAAIGGGAGRAEKSASAGGANELHATLSGFQETPAISTPGRGTLELSVSEDQSTVAFTLTYADLKGVDTTTNAPALAHIHLGQRGVAGGVAVFFCGGGGRPACPAQPATVTGTFTASDVVGPTAQGLDAGALADLLAAARAGFTYVNVHTARFPTGEIRGQVKAGDGAGDEGHDD